MTYSPTMKFHNYFPKNILYSIFLIYILSSCASLNTSNETYNLAGKFSFVSDEYSAIFSVKIITDLHTIKINLYEPINGTLFTSLKGSKNTWVMSNQNLEVMKSIFPKPKELLYLIGDKCLKNTNCKFEFDTDDNAKVKVLLQNV